MAFISVETRSNSSPNNDCAKVCSMCLLKLFYLNVLILLFVYLTRLYNVINNNDFWLMKIYIKNETKI